MSRARGLLAVVIAIAVIAAIAILAGRGPARGPLQPTTNVNSFGLPVADGSTMSLVVELRGEQAVSATLNGISLASADPGLTLADAGILVDGYPGRYVAESFPLGALAPIGGTTISTDPTDPTRDVFINLGIRADFGNSPLRARGVWLDYEVAGVKYRALLPWLLTVCRTPTTDTCAGIPAQDFSFPP